MDLSNVFKFNYNNKEYNLYEIIGKENIYEGEEFGKPIILKNGIQKLCNEFGFVDIDYKISWLNIGDAPVQVKTESGAWRTEQLGVLCTVIIYMEDTNNNSKFIGDGEANAINCKGIAAAHMQAMAIKRARSRAILQKLGIDAYGEDESQEFEKKTPYTKALKTFIANSITDIASKFEKPIEQDALRDSVREYFGLKPEDRFTFDNLNSNVLMEFYGKMYSQYLAELSCHKSAEK